MPVALANVPDATIPKVLAWVADDPVRAALALEVEHAGRARTTLIARLDQVIADHPVEVSLADRKTAMSEQLLASADRLHGQLFAPTVQRKAVKVSDGPMMGDRVEIVNIELDEPTFSDKRTIASTIHILVDKALELAGNTATNKGGVLDELAAAREKRRAASTGS